MKKLSANLLIVLFVLMIIGASSQSGKTHRQPGDVAGAVGALIGCLLLLVGLFYSARWRISLSGHSYKLGQQTIAALLFWYAVFAAFIGLMAPLVERTTFGLTFAAVMIVVWSSVAYACKRWQQRLRAAEHSYLTQTLTPS
ncbi:MAG: hypothetical protein ACRD59_16190 [Candidatus Acidiferrales bacterium]